MKFIFLGLGSAGQRHLKNINKMFPKAFCYGLKNRKINKVIDHKNQKILGINIENKYKIKFIDTIEELKTINPEYAIISSATANHLDHVEFLLKVEIRFLNLDVL